MWQASVPRPMSCGAQIEKDEDYIKTVVRLGAIVEDVVKQNNALDIYEEYFAGQALDHSMETPVAHTMMLLKDPTPIKRGAQYACWHPDASGKVCPLSSRFTASWCAPSETSAGSNVGSSLG